MGIFIYDLSNLIMPFLFCCLSVIFPEKKQMMIRRKKRKRRVDIFIGLFGPLWHNMLAKRHTWVVYLEDWASWFSKCRHCKAVWDKARSHFTAAVTVIVLQSRSHPIYLLPLPPTCPRASTDCHSVNSSQLQWKTRAYDKIAHMLMTHAPCTFYLSFYMLFDIVNKFLFCKNCDGFVLLEKLIWNILFLYPCFLPNSVECG